MNPTAIYSKSGKGVQEASGKTNLLKREHRSVLAAIDGRATLGDVAQKCGRPFDNEFQRLIVQLDKDGFIREVSAGGAASAAPARAGAKAAAKPDTAIDLDFSSLASSQKANTAPKATAPPAPPPPPKVPAVDLAAKAAADRRAKEQESALHRARQEAEEKAQAERERQKAEAEAKVRAETEAKLRVEAEKKLREEAAHQVRADAVAKAQAGAEARVKAAREAAARIAAEAKAKAEAEMRAKLDAELKAREEAERRAKEEAERARREAEEKARREHEELRRRLEEERKAREEIERKAREEAERIRREAEEHARRREAEALLQQIEEARKAREEAERRAREEMARARREAEERKSRKPETEAPPPRAPIMPAATPGAGDKFADSLFADLDSFNKREEENRKADEETERAKKEERLRLAREMEELRARENEELRKAEEKERSREEEALRAKEEEERVARENAENERKFREEEDKRARESEERSRKAREEAVLAAKTRGDMASSDASLQDRRAKALKKGPGVAAAYRRQERNWGKPVAITLLVILGVALGALHVVPISTADYEKAAREALGQPVKIASGRISLLGGVHYDFKDVRIGERVRIAEARAFPELAALFDEKKIFKRIELEGASVPQEALGEALFAKAKGENFTVGRVVAKQLKLEGPLPLPALDVDAALDDEGALRLANLSGPDNLVARLASKGSELEFEMSATIFAPPIAPELSLHQFGMKGTATRRGMNISAWDGAALNGNVSGTAQVRWGGTWNVDGVVTARGINAAVFAPALLSEGRGEGTGRFSMTGSEPAKLASTGRLEGNFTVNKGVLGSFDLSRAIQTGGRQVTGRTQFTEMNGQATYNGGAVALRNVNIGAGALNAGASADITQSGALSGRIIVDVRTSTQALRAILILGGTVREPQVKN